MALKELEKNNDVMDKSAVRIVEVGPRDGLQNIKSSIPAETKLDLISRLVDTGLKAVELTSIVSPRVIPQLSDCRTILSNPTVRALQDDASRGLRMPVLVPNQKGLSIAIEHDVREIAVFLSATDGFSKANINCTVDEALVRVRGVAEKARARGMNVRGYISCIFEDPFDGPTDPEKVIRVVKELLDAGCYEVSLGDTLGVGTSISVSHLLECLRTSGVPMSRLAGHFHDTYGQAVANIWQAYQCGVRVFDCSVAGLGGCPYCPGATGNAATEDVVFMFEQAGIPTGVDLPKLAAVGCWISNELGVRNVSRAGAALAVKHGLLPEPSPDTTPVIEEKPVKAKESPKATAVVQIDSAWQILFQLAWGARKLLFAG